MSKPQYARPLGLVFLFVLLCCGGVEVTVAGNTEIETRVVTRHAGPVKGLHASHGEDFERSVRSALQRLLNRPDGFVVFEHSGTGKFVQFATSKARGLLLDVPRQILSYDEDIRAEAYFAEQGIDAAYTGPLYSPQTGAQVGIQRSFQVILGSDVETAAAMTAEFFTQVYRIDPNKGMRFIEE